MCILHVLCWLAVGTERWWICWYRRAFCSASHIILCADSAIRQYRATARGRVLCLYLQCHTHKHKLTWIRFILMAARVFAIDPNIQVVRRIALTIKKKASTTVAWSQFWLTDFWPPKRQVHLRPTAICNIVHFDVVFAVFAYVYGTRAIGNSEFKSDAVASLLVKYRLVLWCRWATMSA